MRVYLKFLLSSYSFVFVLTNVSNITACTRNSNGFIVKNKSEHDYNSSLLRVSGIPDEKIEFITFYEAQMRIQDDEQDIKRFDNLYDTDKSNIIFNSFGDVQKQLKSVVMGQKFAATDWESIYSYLNVTGTTLSQAENAQLRFYNIFAKVYGKANVLRLIQSAKIFTNNDGIIGEIIYYSSLNAQRMLITNKFVDLSFLNKAYNSGRFAGTDYNYVVDHEYGHALSNFIGTNLSDRPTFNDNWISDGEDYELNNCKYNSLQNGDRTQLLLDYLNKKGNEFAKSNNLDSYYYPSDGNYKFFPLILLQSEYSRLFAFNTEEKYKDEYFAEAFAYWLTTPRDERGWNWGLFNDFFLDVLPKYVLN